MFESCAPAKLTVPTSVTGTEPLSSITRLARAVLEISRMTGPLSGAGRSGLTAVAVPTTVEAGQVLFATLLGGHAGCPTVATAAAGRTTWIRRGFDCPGPTDTVVFRAGEAPIAVCPAPPIVPVSFGSNGSLLQPVGVNEAWRLTTVVGWS